MLASRLDRRVRKEATALVGEARAALLHKKELRGKAGDLGTVTADMEKALAADDLGRVRVHLPVLDSLVDELVTRKPKPGLFGGLESLVTAILLALVLRAFVVEAFKIPSSSMYPTLEIGDHIFVNKFIYGLRVPWTNIKFFELRGPRRGEVIVFKQPCQPDRDYIKRVIGVAGDTVEVRCDVVYVNGTAIPSQHVEGECGYEDNQTGAWRPMACSRYRETVAGERYDTYHSALRPEHPPTAEPRIDFPLDETPPTCAGDHDGKPSKDQLPGTVVVMDPGAAEDACAPRMHYVVPEGHVFVMGDNRANSNDSRFWGAVPLDHIKGKAMFIWLSYRDSLFELGGFRWRRIGGFVE